MICHRWAWVLLPVGGLVVLFLSTLCGADWISPRRLLDTTSSDYEIWIVYRLPRIMFVFLVGASLSLVGSVYQSILNNSLADPYILGTSSAAALGIVLVGVIWAVPVYAGLSKLVGVGMALALAILLLAVNRRFGIYSSERLLLFGFASNLMLSSVLFIVLSVNSNVLGGGTMQWLFGRIPWVSWGEFVLMFSVLAVCLLPFFTMAEALNAISLGDGVCKTLGFSPYRTRSVALVVSSLVVAIVVSYTGAIGFVGLIIPHMSRRLFGVSLGRASLYLQLILGGGFLAVCDAVSRGVHPPLEIPIGLVTTLLGGPVFLYLLWSRQ